MPGETNSNWSATIRGAVVPVVLALLTIANGWVLFYVQQSNARMGGIEHSVSAIQEKLDRSVSEIKENMVKRDEFNDMIKQQMGIVRDTGRISGQVDMLVAKLLFTEKPNE